MSFMSFRDLFNVVCKFGRELKGEADVKGFCDMDSLDSGSSFDCVWGGGIDLTIIPARFRQIFCRETQMEWYRTPIIGRNLSTIPKEVLTIDKIGAVYDGSLFQAGDYFENVIFISGTLNGWKTVHYFFNDIGVDSTLVPFFEYSRIADMVVIAAEELERKEESEQDAQVKKDEDELPF